VRPVLRPYPGMVCEDTPGRAGIRRPRGMCSRQRRAL